MIERVKFVHSVLDNVSRVTHYELGQDGRNGGCDCIGLVIGALRMAGEKWTGTHGSNYAARNEMTNLWRLEDAADLMPGLVVYKAKTKSQQGYALPDKYKSGSDLNDYYHVGVVTAIEPLEITHCTGVEGGIKRDRSADGWTHYGPLKKVSYVEEVGEMENKTMYVQSDNGKPVKLRMNANRSAGWYTQLEVGTMVEVLPWENAEWHKVYVDGMYGYMLKEFLTDAPPGSVEVETDDVHLILTREVAEKLLDALARAL